jgi:tripeptide aminopeptidase
VSVALGDTERRRLHETFAALCRIPSPTGRERACADWVIRELGGFGLEVAEDDAGPRAGSDAGNLLVRIPGRSPDWLLLCAHLDTVPVGGPVEPLYSEGAWTNAAPGILGADNKAAVAALVEVARRFAGPGRGEAPPVGLELLFTVCEETGLHGAAAFDLSSLRSRVGFVFDHASPLGEVVVASPTHQRLSATIRGQAAHAGLEPEAGRSAIAAAARAIAAMSLGRIDAETTANIGLIEGGSAVNVVPERCRVQGEVRGLDPKRVEAVLTGLIDALQDAADADGCDLDITSERLFSGYRLKPGDPGVELAGRALRGIGYEPRPISTGAGSDANAFRLGGFACVNLANGTERAHQPDERVSGAALEDGLRLALALIERAAG